VGNAVFGTAVVSLGYQRFTGAVGGGTRSGLLFPLMGQFCLILLSLGGSGQLIFLVLATRLFSRRLEQRRQLWSLGSGRHSAGFMVLL
jgi:hypothetical protein